MTGCIAIACLSAFCVVAHAGEDQLVYRGQLHEKIKDADRIVVRDGGDTCCVSADETLKQRVCFEVTDEARPGIQRVHRILERS